MEIKAIESFYPNFKLPINLSTKNETRGITAIVKIM
jgi:hypothetical protein